MKVSLCIARFPYKGAEHPDTTDWLLDTQRKIMRDPRIGEVYMIKLDDTPITMTRNAAVDFAQQKGVDYMLMIDSDMAPDLKEDGAKPFWDTSLNFVLAHRDKPCIVAAPYVGPPPHCNIYVFRWNNHMNDCPNPDHKLDQFTRSEAEMRVGIEEVAALPTGLMLIDMRAFKSINPPYFYYEWLDEREHRKASTEDVTFTRDISLAGVPIYCNWDSWAGHWKAYRGDKPKSVNVWQLREKFSLQVLGDLAAEMNKEAASIDAEFLVQGDGDPA